MSINQNGHVEAVKLEQMVSNMCFCKLREYCKDKDSVECMRHRNIYAEFMQQKHTK
jgi:hypothetical protein